MPESKDAVGFFDTAAGDYAATFYGDGVRSLMTVRQSRILEFVDALRLPPGARVLDAGCGPGFLLRELAARDFRSCGFDASAQMLQRARAAVRGIRPSFATSLALASIERIPYRNDSFDLACSAGVIEYLPRDREALSELFRVLRPGGHLILPVTNALSPVNWLDFALESMKRRAWIVRPFNLVWQRLGHAPVRPRHFRVRRHRPARLRAALAAAGFRLEDAIYFHFLPWPHPFDRLMPGTSAALGGRMERLARSSIGPIAEGYLALASKSPA